MQPLDCVGGRVTVVAEAQKDQLRRLGEADEVRMPSIVIPSTSVELDRGAHDLALLQAAQAARSTSSPSRSVCLLVGPIVGAFVLGHPPGLQGPVIFRQVRVGRDGRHFSILNFRRMLVDAEARKDQLRARSEDGAGLFKIRSDPRVTRVGRFRAAPRSTSCRNCSTSCAAR
jgi:hypothetical protein